MSFINTNTTSSTGAPSSSATAADLESILSTVDAHANFDDPGDADAVLAQGADFVAAGGDLVRSVSEEIEARTRALEQGIASGAISGQAAETEQQKIAVATKLRDSMATSVQNVADIVSGTSDTQAEDDAADLARIRERRQLDLDALARHQFELQQQVQAAMTQVSTTTVAATYRA